MNAVEIFSNHHVLLGQEIKVKSLATVRYILLLKFTKERLMEFPFLI